jgi:hypothetical protein
MDKVDGFKLYEEWIAPIPASVFKNMCDTCCLRAAGDALFVRCMKGERLMTGANSQLLWTAWTGMSFGAMM